MFISILGLWLILYIYVTVIVEWSKTLDSTHKT